MYTAVSFAAMRLGRQRYLKPFESAWAERKQLQTNDSSIPGVAIFHAATAVPNGGQRGLVSD